MPRKEAWPEPKKKKKGFSCWACCFKCPAEPEKYTVTCDEIDYIPMSEMEVLLAQMEVYKSLKTHIVHTLPSPKTYTVKGLE